MECTAKLSEIQVDVQLNQEELATVRNSHLLKVNNVTTWVIKNQLKGYDVNGNAHDHSGFMKFVFNISKVHSPRTAEEAKKLVEKAVQACLKELRK